ncbi:unnamed protein product, partial [Cladocopium goreaui]
GGSARRKRLAWIQHNQWDDGSGSAVGRPCRGSIIFEGFINSEVYCGFVFKGSDFVGPAVASSSKGSAKSKSAEGSSSSKGPAYPRCIDASLAASSASRVGDRAQEVSAVNQCQFMAEMERVNTAEFCAGSSELVPRLDCGLASELIKGLKDVPDLQFKVELHGYPTSDLQDFSAQTAPAAAAKTFAIVAILAATMLQSSQAGLIEWAADSGAGRHVASFEALSDQRYDRKLLQMNLFRCSLMRDTPEVRKKTKRVYITYGRIQRSGPTPGCRACLAHTSNHTPECMARHEEAHGHASPAPTPRGQGELSWKSCKMKLFRL